MTPDDSHHRDTVDHMLLDAGHGEDDTLRAALLSLGSLASLPAPTPGPELAALLGAPQDQLSRRRRPGRHRPTIVGLAVVAGMGLGVTGVAASSSQQGPQAIASVQHLLERWAPSWSMAGQPAAGPPAEPGQGAGTAPAAVTAPASGDNQGQPPLPSAGKPASPASPSTGQSAQAADDAGAADEAGTPVGGREGTAGSGLMPESARAQGQAGAAGESSGTAGTTRKNAGDSPEPPAAGDPGNGSADQASGQAGMPVGAGTASGTGKTGTGPKAGAGDDRLKKQSR